MSTLVRSGAVSARRLALDELMVQIREAGVPGERLVILLHGFPETGAAWHTLLQSLGTHGWHAVAPDLRGYGASDAPVCSAPYALDRLVSDVIGLADALGAEHFSLVGHDWGGVIAWAVAARHPERILRLVILDAPHPDTVARGLWRHPLQIWRSLYIGFFQLPAVPERMLGAFGFWWLRRSLVGTARAGTFPPRLLATYREAWAKPGRLTTMLGPYRALRRHRAQLGRISTPTLILWGAHDRFLGTHLARAAAEMCDDVLVTVVRDAGHWLHHEAPHYVARLIANFLHPAKRPSSG